VWPNAWSALSALQYLQAENTGISGTLPASWSGMASVRAIDLYLSWWQPGVAPDAWPDWSGMVALEHLDLSWANTSPFTGASCSLLTEASRLKPVATEPSPPSRHIQPRPSATQPNTKTDPIPTGWFTRGAAGMRSLRTLRLAGNEWTAPLDPGWGDNSTSWWVDSLEVLDVRENAGVLADVPVEWQNLKLRELYVSRL